MCEECKSIFLSPRLPEKILMESFYSDELSSLHRDWLLDALEAVQGVNYRYRLDEIYRHQGSATGRLLDVGCACGGFLLEARRRGWDAIGQEVSVLFASVLHERGISMVHDLKEVEHGSVDTVTLWSVFEHVYEPGQLLEELRTKLRSGGLLCIAVPNSRSAGALLFGADWPLFTPPEHVVCFAPEALRKLLLQHGFRIRQMRTTCCWSYVRNALLQTCNSDPGDATRNGPAFYRKVIDQFDAGDMIEVFAERI